MKVLNNYLIKITESFLPKSESVSQEEYLDISLGYYTVPIESS